MTILTKADRLVVVQRVTKETFDPKFDALTRRLTDNLRKRRDAEHPEFIKLLGSDAFRPYLAVLPVIRFECSNPSDDTKTIGMRRPTFRALVDFPARSFAYHVDNCLVLSSSGVRLPARNANALAFETDAELMHEYVALWDDFRTAWQKLENILQAYKTHEKLQEYFPELTARLPNRPIKAQLPAVVVPDMRAELIHLGVLK